ncbi:MAG TPA: DUF5994 family protein [Actinocrinis sp.]|nr:DUF5994 family protein [Actinocrinis sp.]
MMPERANITSVPIRSPGSARSAAFPAPRLSLEPTLSRAGMFDGAWWPRTRDAGAELPGLLDALSSSMGAIVQVGLDIDEWDDVPRRLVAGGRTVQVGWSPARDHTMSVTCSDQGRFLLLVIPPQTVEAAAAAATWMATRIGNCGLAAEIFAIAGVTPAIPDRAPMSAALDAEGTRERKDDDGTVSA